MSNLTLNVRIVTPKQILYQGEVLSISSKNSTGKFDILPKHANFVTIIERNPIIIRPPKDKPLVFNLPLAIIHTEPDMVSIYTYSQI